MAGQLLQSLKRSVQSGFAKAPTLDPNDGLEDPPPKLIGQLNQEVQFLPVPIPYQEDH